MLYIGIIDFLFMLVGLLIGVALTACVGRSGYIHKCDNCIYQEVLEMFEEVDHE